MKVFPDKVLIGAIFFVMLAISVVVFVYYGQSKRTQRTAAEISHTNEVLYYSSKVLASLEEHVLRARAFGLSGDSSHLEPQERARSETYSQLSNLRKLTADNPSQQKRIDSLSKYIDKRVQFSNHLANIRKIYGRDSVVAVVSSNEGLALVENIRVITSSIEDEEQGLLRQRREKDIIARKELQLVLLVMLFFVAMLVLFMVRKVKSDISNFRKAETDLKYNAILLKNMSDAVVSTDNNFRIKSWNKRAEEMYGFTEEEAYDKPAPAVFKVEMAQADIAEFQKKIVESAPWQGELIHHRKTGESFPVHISISPLYNEKNLRTGTVAVIRDITIEKQAEEQMKMFNEQLQRQVEAKTLELTNVFGRVAEGFIAFDKNWRYTFINKKAEEVMNINAADLLGTSVSNIYPSFSEQPFFAPLLKAMEEQRYYSYKEFMPDLNRWFENHAYPSPDGVSVFFRDITSEVQSEIALRQSEERTRTIINSALDAIICMNADGYITVWNPRAEKKFGWTAGEAIGKKLSDLIVPERLRDEHNRGLKRYLETGEGRLMNRVTETSALRRDGTEFPVELTVIDVNQPDQNFFCAFVRDITERVQAQSALRKSEEMHRLIVETANEGIWMIDQDAQTTYVNEQMAMMLGYTRDEMIGHSMYSFITADLKKQAGQNLEKRKLGVSEHHEFVLTRKDGSEIQTLMGTTPIIMDGDYRGALAMVIDITERKIAEQQIKREKELSDSIINSLPGIFYFFDFEGNFLKWNKNFETLSGYASEEIRNMKPYEFFVGADREHIKRAIQKAFISGYADTEANFMSRAGIGYITYFSGRRIDVDGKPCLIGMGIDISDLKKAQDELHILTNQLRKLSSHLQDIREEERSMIAKEIHDELGQQLTGLRMDVSWLKKIDELSTEEVRDRVESVQDLLDVTINTVRKISSDLRPGMLDDLGLVDTLEWQSREFSKRFGINVHFDSNDPDAILPSSISLALFRVFQESLTNIARHSKATKVDVVLHISDDEIQLSINDNGVGFDASQVSSKRTLGLVGMRERLLAVNGSFEVISDPGKGTTIFVTVPSSSNNI